MFPEPLHKIAEATRGGVWTGRIWLVGGAVRDQLLGRPPDGDFDVMVEGDGPELALFLWGAGTSQIQPVAYPRFGTALIRVAGRQVEIASARKESYAPDSRKPDVAPATILEDAERRDFTVNALLRNLHSGELKDPLGVGLEDLEAKVLRTPREPRLTFEEDPLRMLRAVRFRHQLGFSYAPGLAEAIQASAHRLSIISAERIRDELVKVLALPSAADALGDLEQLGLLREFAPELADLRGVEQGDFHHLDAWDHTLLAVQNLGPAREDLVLSLSTLLHDVGKAPTRTVDADGRTRFFGHESRGAEMSGEILRRLRLADSVIAPVVQLVKNHMRLGSAPTFSDSAARRLLRDLGDNLDRLLVLVEADAEALKPGVRRLDLAPIRAQIAKVARATPRKTLVSPLSGDEIMEALRLPAGETVGRLKAALADAVLEGTLKPGDKPAAVRLAKQLFQEVSDICDHDVLPGA